MLRFAVCILIAMAISIACHAQSPRDSMEKKCTTDRLAAEEVPPMDQYDCWMALRASGAIQMLPIHILLDAKRMLYGRVFNLGDKIDADSMGIIVNELDRRPHQGDSQLNRYYHALLSVGRPAEAEELIISGKIKNPSAILKRIPLKKALTASSAVYWISHAGENHINEREVDLTSGAHVVVYVTPGCIFCMRAVSDIRKIPAVYKFFRENGLWIHLPDINHGREFYDEWNLQNEEFPIGVIFDRHNWPPLPKNGLSPTFTFYKDGQIVAVERGYPVGKMDKIIEHLRNMGIIRK